MRLWLIICYSFPKVLPMLVAAEQVIKMTERVTEEGLLVVSGRPHPAAVAVDVELKEEEEERRTRGEAREEKMSR